MRNSKAQTGSVHIVVTVVLIAALIGALGFVFWSNFLKKEAAVSQTENKPSIETPCAAGENTAAENGTFCSQELGLKFAVPSIFVNKLIKVDNYEVFQGPLDPNAKKTAGSSENVYQATISGSDNFTFTIAQEPLRTGYVDVPHLLQNTYYDQATGELTRVNAPTRQYDSARNATVTSGDYSKGEVVPSFTVGDVRFFKGTDGDAGQVENIYFGVVKNKIIKMSLKNIGYIGDPATDPTTIDADQVFTELDASIKALKFI